MAVKVILCLSVLFSFAASVVCPTFSCKPLSTNVCASKVSARTFQVNENGCDTGYYCAGAKVDLWANNLRYTTNTTIYCEQGDFMRIMNSESSQRVSVPCPIADPKKKFKNGELWVTCSSDSDCVLVDGDKTFCACTFNSGSTGYCYPHESNEDFLGPDYWRDCGTRHTITDANTATYWLIYEVALFQNLGSIKCTDIFAEINFIEDFQNQITTGATYNSTIVRSGSMPMVLGVLAFLALH